MYSLSEKIVAVTGSSSGIGRETAILAAKSGASVILHFNRNRDGVNETANAITNIGADCAIFQADFQEPLDRTRFCEEAWNWKSNIDVLVNNAGGDVLTNERKNWSVEQKLDFLWQVDVMSCIHLSRDLGKKMFENSVPEFLPAIINIGWDQAKTGQAGENGEIFATTKGAIMSFSKSLAKSLAPKVRVNCVAPGWIQTAWGEGTSEYWDDRAKSESLLSRWGSATDIANVICQLASKECEFINGQVIDINGGQSFGVK